MNDLPKVFANKIDKEINNSQERTFIDEKEEIDLNDILTKDKYSFNHKYSITLRNGSVIDDSIIQINSDKLLTIDNGWIGVNSIRSIKEIKM